MSTETTQERNCAFQYAKVFHRGFGNRTEIVCDETELTLAEAKELWKKHYPDCAKHIANEDNTAEMVIWINMADRNSYGDSLVYISNDAETDGKRIWQTKREYFLPEIE